MNIEIREMLESEFETSIHLGQDHYIEGKAKAMNIPLEEAREKALQEYNQILPEGFRTKNHKFYTALVDGEYAGFAWVHIKEEETKISAWGYDIQVKESFRRNGVAKKIFRELESELKKLNVKEVSFHVYADNFRAIPLYEQFGFKTTNIVMRKEI